VIVPAVCAAAALAGILGASAAHPAPASAAALQVGVYQDDPVAGVPVVRVKIGKRATRVISTYVTGGQVVSPKVIALARSTKARLMVSWLPDGGKDGASQKRYRLSAIRRGKQDAGLKRLVAQLRTLRPAPILRPMPEPNTPWYAWSGTVNGNTPAAYVEAWKRVRKVVRKAGGKRILLLWSPYARSVPATPANAITAYFPGAAEVDLVGTSAYNFGASGGLAWTDPDPLFEDAYRQISALSPKPFWIAETGSTSVGGSREKWISQLTTLRTSIPNLAGIVWFDVRDSNGDFRISASKKSRIAFSKFLIRVKAR
jgi:hypothetical protein